MYFCSMNRSVSILLLSALFLFVSACQNNGESATEPRDESQEIIATTSIVADMLQNLCPPEIEVKGLMGPGTDPHLYKPTFSDYEAIRAADHLVLSGLHLEGKMADVMLGMKGEKHVLELAEPFIEADKIKNNDFADGHDPHYWMDIGLWKKAAAACGKTLESWFPDHQEAISSNTRAYIKELEQLEEEVKQATANIPEEQRLIITSHDALNYYARAYGYRVRSLQGFSTAAEFGLKDVSDLVDFIIAEKVPAVFVENIVSDQALNAVVQGCKEKNWRVVIGGSLYTDALGEEGSGADSYTGMIRHNTKTISTALSANTVE